MSGLKRTVVAVLILVFPRVLFAEVDQAVPDYSETMAKNILFPGLGFRLLGNEVEARRYYASLPLSLGGAGLALAGILVSSGSVLFDVQYHDGETYLLRYNEQLDGLSQVMLYSGVVLGLYGNLLATYSSYGVHRDYVDRFGDPFHDEPVTTGRATLQEVISAPFRATNIFAGDVLPILGLATIAGFSISDYRMMGEFFKQDSVPFMGFMVPPAAGLGLRLLSSALLVAANASWEEIAYRGLSLETSGEVYSSLSFGLAHITNMLVPGASVEGTLLQTLFATAFGYYAAQRVMAREYDFSHMVALHFWHNTLSLVLGYLADPEEAQSFSIRFRL